MAVRTCDSPRHEQGTALPNSPTPPSSPFAMTGALARCRAISRTLGQAGLYQPAQPTTESSASTESAPAAITWRVSPEPFWLTTTEADFFEVLGGHLHAFYRAVNQLYHASRKGQQPAWVARYFDQGKPDTVIDYGRMNRFKQQLPGIIRPDIIPAASPFSIGSAPRQKERRAG